MTLKNQINQSRFKQYASALANQGLSDSTIKRKLSSLSTFQKFLVKKKLLEPNTINIENHSENQLNKVFSSPVKGRWSANWRIGGVIFNRYLVGATFLIIILALSFGLYTQTILKAKNNLAYSTAAAKITPNRILSFQGRLTDTSSNPITSSTGIIFNLYNNSVGGTLLYNSGTGNSQTVTPDENGIFSVVIGKTHGAGIPSTVFSENADVYLEIVGGGETMTPRQQIATVGYALNAETLQGLPPSASGNKDTVVVVDGLGNINLGETSPSIKSISGTMGIEGQAILIKTSTGSAGNITINPDADGTIKLITSGLGSTAVGQIEATNANFLTGNLFSGIIRNDNRGYNFVSYQNYNVGTTTLSTRFSVNANGNVTASGTINASIGITTPKITLSTGASSGYILQSDASGNATWVSSSGVGGTYTANNGITLSGSNFQLGGTLSQLTKIDQNSNDFNFYGTGNVGIGTTNPAVKLDVGGHVYIQNGAAQTGSVMDLFADATGTNGVSIASGFWNGGYGPLKFNTSNTTSMIITAAGNVGIGTTAPTQKLQINGTNPVVITSTGRIGIGTTSPNNDIEISSSGNKSIMINGTGTTDSATIKYYNGTMNYEAGIFSDNRFSIRYGSTPSFTIDTLGRVGISTTAPSFALQIGGTGSLGVGGSVTFSGLPIGTGSTIVYINSSGVLVQGTLPAGTSYTATNGLNLNGSAFGLGGTLTQADYTNINIGVASSGLSILGINNNTQALFISPSGNVGIGTTNPGSKLTIGGAVAPSASVTYDLGNGGAVWKAGYFGTVLGETGSSTAPTFSFRVDTNTGLYRPAADNLSLVTGGIDRLFADASGNVGIGTTNPSKKLDVAGDINLTGTIFAAGTSGSPGQILSSTGVGLSWINASSIGSTYIFGNGLTNYGSFVGLGGTLTQNTQIGTSSFHFDFIGLGGTQSLHLDESGNVGIGTTNPLNKLSVNGDALITTRLGIGVTNVLYMLNVGGTTSLGNLFTSGNVGFGTTAPTSVLSIVGSGNLLSIGDTAGNTLVSITDTNATFNLPTSFTSSGDISLAYDLNFTNATASYIRSSAPLYIQTEHPTNNVDLILSAANAGSVIANDNFQIGGSFSFPQGAVAGYVLQTDASGNASWVSASGVGTTYSANNGITLTGTTFGLGGTLTQNTQIGTSSFHFDFIGLGGTQSLHLDESGNVGIGTTAPGSKLDVIGNVFVSSKLGVGVTSPTRTIISNGDIESWTGIYTPNLTINTMNTTYGGGSTISIGPGLNISGNVGIGTSAPIYKLQVGGTGSLGVGGSVTFSGLPVGTGTSVVYINSSGVLTSGTLPSGTTYTANNGITLTGTTFGLGGSLAANTTIGTSSFNLNIGQGNTQPLFISSGGNVGLGTTAPTTALHLKSSVNGGIMTIQQANTVGNAANILWQASDASNRFTLSFKPQGTLTNDTLTFSSSSVANILTIAGSGNVGIGITSPLYSLQVGGTGSLGVGGSVTFSGLPVGTGTSVVYINSSGVLTSGTLPSGTTYTANNGITLTGTTFGLGGSLAANTTIGTSSFNLNIGQGNTQALFISSSGNVGIGMTSPLAKLQVVGTDGINTSQAANIGGSIGTGLVVTNFNRVGIGTTAPGAALDISGPNTGVLRFTNTSGKTIDFTPGIPGVSNNGLNIRNVTNTVDWMTFDGSGNLGIGTTGPSKKLDVSGDFNLTGTIFANGTSGTSGQILSSTGVGLSWINASSIGTTYTATNGLNLTGSAFGLGGSLTQNTTIGTSSFNLNIGQGNTQALFISSSGNVGIGTTNPSQKLDLNGSLSVNNGSITTNSGDLWITSNSNWIDLYDGTNSHTLNIYNGASTRIRLDASANGFINNGSNFGIGFSNPNYTLDVNGNINTNGKIGIGGTDNNFSFHSTGGGRFDTNLSIGTSLNVGGTVAFTALPIGTGTTIIYINSSGILVQGTLPAGTVYTATNGLNLNGSAFGLGGTLTNDTNIGTSSFNLSLGVNTTSPSLYISSAGNIGIGTSNPINARLELRQLTDSQSGGITVYNSAGSAATRLWTTGTNSASVLFAGTGGGNNLMLNGSGNVGIGTSSPIAKLTVNGDLSVGTSASISSNLSVGGSVTLSGLGLGVTGAGSTVVFIDASGKLSKNILGAGAFTSGTGTTYSVLNGLSAISTNVFGLGGSLTQNTTIGVSSFGLGIGTTGNASYPLAVSGTAYLTNLYNAGNVGIGGTSPGNKLYVSSTASSLPGDFNANQNVLTVERSASIGNPPYIAIVSNNTAFGGIRFADTDAQGSGAIEYDHNIDKLIFTTNGSKKLFLDSSGFLGIGITNPAYRVDVSGDINLTGTIRAAGATGTSGQILTSTGTGLQWVNASGIGGSYTFTNGLTNSSGIVGLGGTLTGNTQIGTSSFGLTLGTNTTSPNLYIASNGNVGIGTTVSYGKLTIAGSQGLGRAVVIDNREISFIGTGVAHMSIYGPDTGKSFLTIQNTSSNVSAGTTGTDLFTITSAGNVGIGTTGPTSPLQVAGNANILGKIFAGGGGGTPTTASLNIQSGADNVVSELIKLRGTQTADAFQVQTSAGTGGDLFTITSSGNVGIGISSPSKKLDIAGDINLTGTIFTTGTSGTSGQVLSSTGTGLAWINNVGTTYSFQNGINLSGSNVGLGGSLTQNTNIGISSFNFLISAGANQVLYIGASNNVGLGTTAPNSSYILDALGRTRSTRFASTAGSINDVSYNLSSNSGLGMYSPGTNMLALSTSSLQRFYIDASGNIGIGTSSPNFTLQVGGTGSLGVGGSVTFSGLPIGTGSTIIYINSSGVLVQGTLPAGGTTYTASNGINLVGSDFRLGGSLSAGTTINLNGFSLNYSGGGSLNVGTTYIGSKLNIGGISTILADSTGNSEQLVLFNDDQTNGNGSGLTFKSTSGGIATTYARIFTTYTSHSFSNPSAEMNFQTYTNGTAYNAIHIGSSGFVGIGITNPAYSLQVGGTGSLAVGGSVTFSGLPVGAGSSIVYISATGVLSTGTLPSGGSTYFANNGIGLSSTTFQLGGSLTQNTTIGTSSFNLNIGQGNTQALFISSGGNVGIGTTNPGLYKLNVGATTSMTNLFISGNVGIGTTAPGSLLSLVGSGNIFSIGDTAGNTLFSITDTAVTSNLPATFNSSGDVSMANDLVFTNVTSSAIKSAAPLSIESGEVFNSSNLTLKTYNSGNIVLDAGSSGDVLPALNLTTDLGSSTNRFNNTWTKVLNIGSSTWSLQSPDNARFSLFNNSSGGTEVFTVSSNGNVGIGATSPARKLFVNGDIGLTGTIFVGAGVTGSSGQVLSSNGAGGLSWITPSGATYTASNGTTMVGSDIRLGGNLTSNTQIGTSTFSLSFLGLGNSIALSIGASGYIGIGTSSPLDPLSVNGYASATRFESYSDANYYFEPANSNPKISSLSLFTLGSMTFNVRNASVGGSQVVINQGYSTRLQNYLNGFSIATNIGSTGVGSTITWSDALFVGASGYVGIGTTNPTSRFQIAGASSIISNTSGDITIDSASGLTSFAGKSIGNILNGYFSGSVGIGTTNPTNSLTVVSNVSGGVNASFQNLSVSGFSGMNFLDSYGTLASTFVHSNSGSSSYPNSTVIGSLQAEPLHFVTGTSSAIRMSIDASGDVGIGTTNPNFKLTVSNNSAATVAGGLTDAVANFSNTDGVGTRVILDGFAGNPNLTFRRANTSAAAPSALTVNDYLGTLGWLGYGASAYTTSARASIAAQAAENWTNTAQGAYMVLSTTSIGSTNAFERLRIDPSGNVGIGTTSPLSELHVEGTGESGNPTVGGAKNATLNLIATNNIGGYGGGIEFGGKSGQTFAGIKSAISDGTSNGIGQLYISSRKAVGDAFMTPVITVTNSGYVGIGTTNPIGPFQVNIGNTNAFLIAANGSVGFGNAAPNQIFTISRDLVRGVSGGTGQLSLQGIGSTGKRLNLGYDTTGNYGFIEAHTFGSGWNNLALQATGGNVGIGTTSPLYPLHVESGGSSGVAFFRNITSGSTYPVVVIQTAGSGTTGATTSSELIRFLNSAGTKSGRIRIGQSAASVVYSVSATADFAEYVIGNEPTEGGDLISFSNGKYDKATLGKPLAGVHSAEPAFVGNENIAEQPNAFPLAMSGIVRLKVSTINGPIKPGDPLTSSSIKGVAAKAITAGNIVASAAEYYSNSDPNQVGMIAVIVNLSWYDPELTLTSTGQVNVGYNISDTVLSSLGYNGSKNEIEAATYNLSDSFGRPVTQIGQFAKLAVAKIEAGLVSTTNLIAKNIVAETTKSKVVKTDLISPLDSVTGTIVADGNLHVGGTLTAQDASFSTVYANNVVSKDGNLSDVVASKVSALRSEMQSAIASLTIASTLPEATPSAIASESQGWTYDIATSQVSITGSLALTDNLVVGSQLVVNGDTQLGNAFITGRLQAGEVAIKDNFIETTNSVLAIQPSGLGTVDILNHKLIIAENGEITVNGNLSVTGNITASTATVSASLFANLINASEINTKKLTAEQINVATDSATVIIAASSTASAASSSATLASNATAGTALLPAGKTELIINNSKITPNSMIYLTPAGSTNNQVVYLKSKSITPAPSPTGQPESNFVIAIDQPLTNDININWWIIN